MKRKHCQIISTDYLDRDVFLNVRIFYQAAGYQVHLNSRIPSPELFVVLRGDPGIEGLNHRGIVHVYDYVKELRFDWSEKFPQASQILIVSLVPSAGQHRCTPIHGYLPVIPALWALPSRTKDAGLVHISNFKPMGTDPYQHDLLRLVKEKVVKVFGGRWQNAGIQARSLSHWQANRMIARADRCLGSAMYPYQRGVTLSGRMWQAPINGCFVISEAGTNIFDCPGIIEAHRFDQQTIAHEVSSQACRSLASQAWSFWFAATNRLAADLKLPPLRQVPAAAIRRDRSLLLLWHLQFLVEAWWFRSNTVLQPSVRRVRRSIAGLARSLGVHPRQLADRGKDDGRRS